MGQVGEVGLLITANMKCMSTAEFVTFKKKRYERFVLAKRLRVMFVKKIRPVKYDIINK